MWTNIGKMLVFTYTKTVPLIVLETLLLLAVLGWVGAGAGVFAVVWKDSPHDEYWFNYGIVWNGFGIGLYASVSAYIAYLLFARVVLEKSMTGWSRLALWGVKAGLFILAANLPAFLPFLFESEFSKQAWYQSWCHYQLRFLFTIGSVVGFGVFAGVVELVTYFRPQSSDVSPKEQLEIQSNNLFCFVWLLFSSLVGYTVVDPERLPRLWTCVAVVAADSMSVYMLWKVSPGRRWIAAILVGLAAIAVFFLITLPVIALEGEGFATLLFAGLMIMIIVVVVLRTLRNDTTSADTGIRYAAIVVHLGLFGGAVGLGLGFLLSGHNRVPPGVIPAALSASLFLAGLASGYGLLRLYASRLEDAKSSGWFYPIVFAVILGFLLCASIRPYPHHLPDYSYSPANQQGGSRAEKPHLSEYDRFRIAQGQKAGLLSDAEVLAKWKAGFGTDKKPPLVIVTTAGGASVSALYTFRLLTSLEETFPGFHRHVRIVSGASGGMLGAAVWRVWLRLRADERKFAAERWYEALQSDFLSPIVQSMLFKDVPMTLACPNGYVDDRGRRLELAWERALRLAGPDAVHLETNFAELKSQEADGGLPSLVFSPMAAEDGRPVYISTLDLDYMAISPRSPDILFRATKNTPGNATDETVRGFEFFKLFPHTGSNEKDTMSLRLATAARMSATFPYFSPPVSLPTVPPRRVVDAGYLDNYGMSVALGWIQEHGVRSKRLQDNASRVIVIEIRPYWDKNPPVKQKGEDGVPPFGWPLHEFTTPPEAAGNARRAGMVGRNDDQLSALKELINDRGERDFLVSLRFCGDRNLAPLNWTLSKEKVGKITEAVTNALADRMQIAEIEDLLGKNN